MRRLLSGLALAGLLAACNGQGDGNGPDDPATATAIATATPAATASASAGGGARSVAEETEHFLFEFSYPAEAGRIVELASLLDVQLEQRREELASESIAARHDAREDGFPYNKHSYTAEWKVIADLPDWLSLAADIATYSGGAHGNYTVDSLIWDKKKERSLEAIDLFTSPAALEDALGERFCDALNRERAERREAPVPEDSEDQFDQCPGIEELEILVGSSNRRTFNRLTLYAGPYVAGPYVEGAYEVDLNVDRAVLAAVKPQYREAFGTRN